MDTTTSFEDLIRTMQLTAKQMTNANTNGTSANAEVKKMFEKLDKEKEAFMNSTK